MTKFWLTDDKPTGGISIAVLSGIMNGVRVAGYYTAALVYDGKVFWSSPGHSTSADAWAAAECEYDHRRPITVDEMAAAVLELLVVLKGKPGKPLRAEVAAQELWARWRANQLGAPDATREASDLEVDTDGKGGHHVYTGWKDL